MKTIQLVNINHTVNLEVPTLIFKIIKHFIKYFKFKVYNTRIQGIRPDVIIIDEYND